MIAWLLNALAQGAMIALVALGYTMVYGVLRLINFAHSEVLMMSAYASVIAQTRLFGGLGRAGLALATLVAIVVAVVLGVTIELVAYRPLRARAKGASARVAPLVTAISVSVLLQSVAQLAFTATPRNLDRALAPPMCSPSPLMRMSNTSTLPPPNSCGSVNTACATPKPSMSSVRSFIASETFATLTINWSTMPLSRGWPFT